MAQTSMFEMPPLRVLGLHVKNLRAIRALDLPGEGLGWRGTVPDVVMIGGPNGTGKTTLFEFIARVFHLLVKQPKGLPREMGTPAQTEVWMDLEVPLGPSSDPRRLRYVQGSPGFVEEHRTPDCFGYQYTRVSPKQICEGEALAVREAVSGASRGQVPGVLFFPSDHRDLVVPQERFKAVAKLAEPDDFVYRWQPPQGWKDSLEAWLYSLRWQDLNEREEQQGEGGRFEAYSQEFARFADSGRRLRWLPGGELTIETAGGERHPLSDLSSGEKQVLILTAEMRRRWRPGSLVLIDEPELHLHDAWQTLLYERLLELRAERGGQVWMATQSGHLFEIGAPDTRLLLRHREPSV